MYGQLSGLMTEQLLYANGIMRFSFPDFLRTGLVKGGEGAGVKVLKFCRT